MLSLIKSKTKKQDGSSGRTGNGKLGKRSRSLISRPIEVLTSANINKLQQQQQQQQNLQSSQQQQNHQESASEPLLVNSSGETVLLQSGGGLSFGFTAMEIPNTSAAISMQRPASVMQPERPSSRSSNSSRR